MVHQTSAQIRALFVEQATAKFAQQVSDFVRLRALVKAQGGTVQNDHGAIRIVHLPLCALWVRAARVLGLFPDRRYAFPAKKLKSFDLQALGSDASQFKVFVSEIDREAYPAEVLALLDEDTAQSWQALQGHNDLPRFLHYLECYENQGWLDGDDANFFASFMVQVLMQRQGQPVKRTTLEAVSAISGEAASALALGPDFNHVTMDVRAAGFADIESMAAQMQAAGFSLLPKIQGAAGGVLRQTATLAATVTTPVREADGTLGSAPTEKQFVEIIERNPIRTDNGTVCWDDHGQPLVFKHFLAANAEKIFDAASTRLA